MKNNLLLRCVRYQQSVNGKELTAQQICNAHAAREFSQAEINFLKKNRIVEVEQHFLSVMGEDAGSYCSIKSFLAPWDKILSDIAETINEFSPTAEVRDQLLPK